jgi:prephenate dehydratase
MRQEKNIACLGPQGSHSEAAARHLFPQGGLLLHSTILSAIEAVCAGQAEFCVVPIENSLEGSINITMDNLSAGGDFCILRELVWPVRHQLLSLDRTSPLQVIMSHPQALAQCRENLKKLYPLVPLREVSSTSEAAALAAGEEGAAAVSSQEAAAIYNLVVRDRDIQDKSINCPRFVVLRREGFQGAEAGAAKTSLACELDGGKSGVLCELLQSFALRDVNLVRIESRPARTALGRYIFFLDLDGSVEEASVKEALAEIQGKTLWLKILGSYPVLTA